MTPLRPRASLPGGTLLPLLAAVPLGLFLALPVAVLVGRALQGGGSFLEVIGRPVVVDALLLSLGTTGVSLAVILLLGTPLAYALSRRSVPGSRILETVVDLPLVLPPAVAGLALLLVFGRSGLLGGVLAELGLSVPFTTLAVVLAQVFVAGPFYVRAARSGFVAVDRDLEDAARADGAGEWAVFRLVTVPLSGAAIGAGLAMAWARALGEFGATIMFAGNIEGRTQTLPLAVYATFQVDLDAAIAAAAVLVLAAFAVLVAVRGTRRGPGGGLPDLG